MTVDRSKPEPVQPQRHRPPWQPVAAAAAGAIAWWAARDLGLALAAASVFLSAFPRKPGDPD